MTKYSIIFYSAILTIATPLSAFADNGENAFEQAREYSRNDQPDKAVQSLQDAVDAGHLEAHNTLAYMYLKGNGIEQDQNRARELFTVAAEAGLDSSQYQLAELIQNTDQDARSAAKWYEKAARQGHVPSMTKLAGLYAEEDNGVTNYVQAYAWYMVAKQAGAYISNGKLDMMQRKMSHNEKDEAENAYKQLIDELT